MIDRTITPLEDLKTGEGLFLILAYHYGLQCSDPCAILLRVFQKTERVIPIFCRNWDTLLQKLSPPDGEYLQAIRQEWAEFDSESERALLLFRSVAEASAGALRPILPLKRISELEHCLRRYMDYEVDEVATVLRQVTAVP